MFNFRDCASDGERISKGQTDCPLMNDGKHLESPHRFTGEVTGINAGSEMREGIINDDPYDKGWISGSNPKNGRRKPDHAIWLRMP